MRKTHIALLVAVVSSPLAFAEGYYYPSYDDGKDITVTDSFNKDIDKTLTVNYDKDVSVKDSFNYDDDYLSLYDVGNVEKHKYIDNSTHDYSQDWDIDFEANYYVASSYLDGAVTYNDVTYGGGCCSGGYGHGYGYPSDPSSVTVTHTNTMNGAYMNAAGVNIAAQNAGNNSLVQQSASTNAMLSN
ncbi:hypothetical protein MD588_07080 [Photobacterium sp. SDRW27]|uniref:hypothetical protein n=1 Tax=Photobacterium obscurum TaxID=2829490 RepID=UPI002243C3FE|nr:hypothetical protein [Photobacterium obscurum]MCW8328568.1 hypothetical protein [Photobacterium obscurum]